MDLLPDELVRHVASFLPLQDLWSLSRTSARLRALVHEDDLLWARCYLWRPLFSEADKFIVQAHLIVLSPSRLSYSLDARLPMGVLQNLLERSWATPPDPPLSLGSLPNAWVMLRNRHPMDTGPDEEEYGFVTLQLARCRQGCFEHRVVACMCPSSTLPDRESLRRSVAACESFVKDFSGQCFQIGHVDLDRARPLLARSTALRVLLSVMALVLPGHATAARCSWHARTGEDLEGYPCHRGVA